MIDQLTHYALLLLRIIAPAAVIFAAQLFLKPKSERAAKWVTVAAALAVVRPLWDALWLFLSRITLLEPLNSLVHMFSPVFMGAAIAGISWGLVQLVDEANPPRVTLPPVLETARGVGANKFALIFWLVGGGLAILGTSGRMWEELNESMYFLPFPPMVVRFLPLGAYFAALALIQYTAWRVQQHGGLARWILTRRPEDVLWVYPHQLTIKRNGVTTGVHWTAMVSTTSGYRVGFTAHGQEHAHALVLAVAQQHPGVIVGFSAESAAAYTAKRKALTQQTAAVIPPTTLR